MGQVRFLSLGNFDGVVVFTESLIKSLELGASQSQKKMEIFASIQQLDCMTIVLA